MSQATELAAAEAARAEAEQPEDEEAAEAEEAETPAETPAADEPAEEAPEAPPEQPPPTEAELRKMIGQLEKEDRRHAKRYAEVLGEQFLLMQPCPRCLESGHIYPVEMAPLEPEQVAAVDASLGRNVTPELKDATDAERCSACDGWGKVTTGAQNPEGAVKICTPCGGLGWVAPGAQLGATGSAPTVNAKGNGTTDAEVVVDLRDAWGRPSGHPHWGTDPATIGV